MNQIPIKILLVEDNEDDIELTRIALRKSKIINDLMVVRDGEEAINFLTNPETFIPDIIFLDLNLPKKSGKEVLKEIKGNENTRRIPVVILTTSTDGGDIKDAYDGYANCYIAKPLDFEGFKEVVLKIDEFWFSLVKLPN